MPADPHETALLCLAQQGDADAFEALHARLEPMVRRYVQRMVADPFAVEDILQETFVTLYRALQRLHPPEKLRPYLIRVARSRAIDAMRDDGAADALDDADDAPSPAMRVTFSHAPSAPDDAARWVLLMLEVQEAIARLPAAQREALTLYAETGLSYEEIAEALSVPLGTAKSRVYHARQTLRRWVHPHVLAALAPSEIADTPPTRSHPA